MNNLESIKEYANKLLALEESEFITKEFKYGVISMIERILLEAKQYKGFLFLDNNNSKADTFGHASRKYD